MLFDIQPGDYLYTNVDVLGLIDGDTIYLNIDKGFHDWRLSRNRVGRLTFGYRLHRIQTPETNRLESRVAGLAARDYLWSLIKGTHPIVKTVKPDSPTKSADDPDDFSRYLIEMWVDGVNINDAMLLSGHAIPYVRKG